ncbi:MAG: tetratricopeptide repeat protein [Treponema sp.]
MGDKNKLQEGISLYNRGNYSAALTFFLSLPEDKDNDPLELAYYLGLCYSKLKRYDDALLYLEQVVTASAENENVSEKEVERVLQCRFLLAVIYCLSGRKKLADFELNKLLDTGYKPASVYSALAYVAWGQGEVDKCLEYYNKALSEDANNPTALNGMGYVLACESTDLTKALSYGKKALELAPDSAACLDTMGWIYFKMGINSEAKSFLEKAQKKDSQSKEIAEHIQELQKVGE